MVELHLKIYLIHLPLNYNKDMKDVSILKCTTPLKVVITQKLHCYINPLINPKE